MLTCFHVKSLVFFMGKHTIEAEKVPGFFYTSFPNKVLFYSPFLNGYMFWRTGTLTLSLFLILFKHIIPSFLLSCAFHSLVFSTQQYCPFRVYFFHYIFHQTCPMTARPEGVIRSLADTELPFSSIPSGAHMRKVRQKDKWREGDSHREAKKQAGGKGVFQSPCQCLGFNNIIRAKQLSNILCMWFLFKKMDRTLYMLDTKKKKPVREK